MGWGPILGQLAAPALVVAVSPFSIVAVVVLLLHTNRPRPNGIAFLVGRLVALGAVTTFFVGVPRLSGDLNRPTSSGLLVGIGVVLVVVACWIWLRRDRMREAPRWLSRLHGIAPTGAGLIGALLVVSNPKMIAASAAAGIIIAGATRPVASQGLSVAYYAAFASSSVAAPALAYAVAGTRVDRQLERVKTWMERRHALLSVILLVVIGIALVVNGIRAL